MIGKARFGRSVCERKPAKEQTASELKPALHGIGMGCHPRLSGEAPYQMELPDVGDRCQRCKAVRGSRIVVDSLLGTPKADRRTVSLERPRSMDREAVHEQDERLRHRILLLSSHKGSKRLAKQRSGCWIGSNGVRKLKARAASFAQIEGDLANAIQVEVKHRPCAGLVADGGSIVDFAGIDRDDVAPHGFHWSASTRGALRTGQNDADPELVVEMAGERPRRPSKHGLDARRGARKRTNDGLRSARHEPMLARSMPLMSAIGVVKSERQGQEGVESGWTASGRPLSLPPETGRGGNQSGSFWANTSWSCRSR